MERVERLAHFRLNLAKIYVPYYDALCHLLPHAWQPYSGPRSIEDQNAKYEQGRSLPGGIITNARGGESPHNYNCATDWTIWENNKPLWLKKDDKRWDEYTTAIWKAGLKAGADFGDVDHNEYPIDVSWKKVNEIRFQHGLDAAMSYIEAHHKTLI
jgi:hypothetical protein